MSEMTHRPDPAPSRLRYRMHRLWLTPLFRKFIRLGLPLIAVALTALIIWTTDSTRFAIQGWIVEARRSIEERPEFMVHAMAIDGASESIAEDIREIAPLDFPVSSFHLDLDGMKARIAELDAVARVDLRVRAGGVLQVDIVERLPVAIWRVGNDLELLDGEGHRVAAISSRLERPTLPLIVGEGAERAVPEALTLMNAAAPVAGRMRALVRVGERRWDLVLDREQVIKLPETGALDALERVMALDEAYDLLSRDVVAVDYRNPDRATIQLNENAHEALRDFRDLQKQGNE